MKTDDSILEVCFLIRSYGKGELAMCYIHGVTQQAAVNRFNTWIRKAPGLDEPHGQKLHSRPGASHSQCFRGALEKGWGTRGRVCPLVRMPKVGYNNHKVVAGPRNFPYFVTKTKLNRMKYPIGIQSFESLIKDGYVYVEKTDQIYQLTTTGRYYLLSRPRRISKGRNFTTD